MLSLNCSSCQSRQRLENLANIPEIQNLPAESLSCSSSISLELGAGPFSAHQNLKSRDPQQIRAVQVWTNKCCNHNPDALFIKHSELLIKAKQGFFSLGSAGHFYFEKNNNFETLEGFNSLFSSTRGISPSQEASSHILAPNPHCKKELGKKNTQRNEFLILQGKKLLRAVTF